MIRKIGPKLYFLYGKRTLRGTNIVILGLMILIITQLLLSSANYQIMNITDAIERNENLIILEKNNKNNFSSNDINTLLEFSENNENVRDIQMEYRINLEIFHFDKNRYMDIQTHFIDTSDMLFQKMEMINHTMIGNDMRNIMDLGDVINIQKSNFINYNFTLVDFIDVEENYIDSGIYFSYELLNDKPVNYIYMNINPTFKDEIESYLIENLEVKLNNNSGETSFIQDSNISIRNIFSILIILMTIMLIIGIYNIEMIILHEAKYEIRNLKSIGYNLRSIRNIYFSIFTIFLLLGGLISIPLSLSLTLLLLMSGALIGNITYIPLIVESAIFIDIITICILSITVIGRFVVWRGIK